MVRAHDPPAASPPFDPPKLCDGRRTAGHVQVPDPTTEDAGPLEMSWKAVSAGALVEPSPTKLRRTSSIAGNILVAAEKKSYWLQRKITEESHSHNYVRIGFPLQNVTMDGEEMSNAWTVCKAEEGSMYPFEMVAIKVQSHRQVFPEDEDDEEEEGEEKEGAANKQEGGDDDNDNSNSQLSYISDASVRMTIARNAKNEISALQLIKAADPDGNGNVLRAELVVQDQVDVYVIMPYCKEGTLMDMLSADSNGRLEETEARKYFRHVLNGLKTLQKVKLCHRNLSLENVLIRGDVCYISSLGLSLRVPVSEDGTVLKLVPQAVCGKKPEYIAPEVFQNEPFDGYAVDLWAAGVMLCQMLFGGDVMFSAPIPEDPKFQEICIHGHLKAVVDKFQALVTDQKAVSDAAIDLLQSMLRADPAERLTLSEVQEHPWLKDG